MVDEPKTGKKTTETKETKAEVKEEKSGKFSQEDLDGVVHKRVMQERKKWEDKLSGHDLNELVSAKESQNEAEKQNLAFDDYEKELNKSIQDRALASGLLTAAVAGGGKLVEKIKEAKAAKAAKQLAEAKEALGIPKALEEAKEGYEYIMSSGAADASGTSITSTTGVTKPKTVQEGMEMLKGYTEEYSGVSKSVLPSKSGLPSDISVASGYDKISIDKSLGKKRYMISDALSESVGFGEEIVEDLALKRAPLSTSIKSQFAAATPLTAEAAPTMMDAYMTGLKGMASDYAQKSILASGAMGIYGYRPELQSLRPIQMMTPTYQTRQRTRTA